MLGAISAIALAGCGAASETSPSDVSLDAASSGAGPVPASLQAFLTSLQQGLGYGSSSASAIGSLVTAQV